MSVLVDLPEIEPFDRFGFYALNGLVSLMEPDTEDLMQERALHDLIDDEYDSPHARAWHVSMHASEFPGDPANACERYFIYRMMNIPARDPMPPWVTTTGTLGKAGELDIADAWHRGGRMLAVPEDPAEPGKHQLGFADGSVWMTASTDLPVLKKGWRKPYIVEVKGKADEVLDEMISGVRKDGSRLDKPRGPDERHGHQLQATLGLAGEYDWGEVTVCAGCWRIQYADIYQRLGYEGRVNPAIPAQYVAETNLQFCYWCGREQLDDVTFQLEPPDCGEIYYWSRSWPRKTKSFFFARDQQFLDRGREVLARARESFILGKLPPRPDHFQWSIGPCGFCRLKPSCRLDAGLSTSRKRKPDMPVVVELARSNAIDHARSMRQHYDFEATRARVIEEWS